MILISMAPASLSSSWRSLSRSRVRYAWASARGDPRVPILITAVLFFAVVVCVVDESDWDPTHLSARLLPWDLLKPAALVVVAFIPFPLNAFILPLLLLL